MYSFHTLMGSPPQPSKQIGRMQVKEWNRPGILENFHLILYVDSIS